MAFPLLQQLDRASLQQAAGTAYSDMDFVRARCVIKEVAQANTDRSACTCLSGNACTDPAACYDWEQRFEIARRVRDERATSQGNIGMLD